MLQVPAATAVTTPEDALTVATPVLLLLHAPLPPLNNTSFALNVVVVPMHMPEAPVTEPMLEFGYVVSVTGVLEADVQAAVGTQVRIT